MLGQNDPEPWHSDKTKGKVTNLLSESDQSNCSCEYALKLHVTSSLLTCKPLNACVSKLSAQITSHGHAGLSDKFCCHFRLKPQIWAAFKSQWKTGTSELSLYSWFLSIYFNCFFFSILKRTTHQLYTKNIDLSITGTRVTQTYGSSSEMRTC